jgi:lipopolysaccharide/colanic/teichoic acid biosynthesis glycosyltransferase
LTSTTEIEKHSGPALEGIGSDLAADLPIGRGRVRTVRPENLGRRRRALTLKRVGDVVGATIGLVISAPLMIMIALLVKLDSPGPALFAQRRVGLGGGPFRCLKFRTMRADAELHLKRDPVLYDEFLANGHKLPVHEDPRVTPLGRVLRRTSLDELPQLLNVLAGQMSLVGPRPLSRDEIAYFGSQADRLLSVRPGMTGLWAVSGRSDVGYPKRARLELAYVGRWSLRHDVCILAKTVLVVVTGAGAR